MHTPTDKTKQQIKIMAAMGLQHAAMARIFSISVNTLKKHYRHELATGRDELNTAIVTSLAKNALKGNVVAQMFWCKTRIGWRENDIPQDKIVIPTIVYQALPPGVKPPEEITDNEEKELLH